MGDSLAEKRWNFEHPLEETEERQCPVREHKDCYNPLPDNPHIGFCFSTSHERDGGRGIKTDHGYIVSPLDVESHLTGKTKEQILQESGESVRTPIYLSDSLFDNVNKVENVLIQLNPQELFDGPAGLTRVLENRESGETHMMRINLESLELYIDQHMEFRIRSTKEENKWIRKRPPKDVVKCILEKQDRTKFQYLKGVVPSAILRSDGSLFNQSGFDPKSGYYSSQDSPLEIPKHPTKKDANDALQIFKKLTSDFPFATETDRMRAIAYPLTIVARPGILGNVPIFCASANTPGTGKTLLTDTLARAVIGQPPPITTQPLKEDETRKALLSYALFNPPTLIIDNVRRAFGDGPLAQIATSSAITDRVLGRSQIARCPFRTVLACTGNNLEFQNDMNRRVVVIEMRTSMESPESRTDFLFPAIKQYATKEWKTYRAAALTMLLAYRLHGTPPARSLGSFEEWYRLVTGTLEWLTGMDILDNRDEVKSFADNDKEWISQVHDWLLAKTDGKKFKASDIFSDAVGMESPFLRFTNLSVSRLGSELKKIRNRVVDGRVLESKRSGGSNSYQVVEKNE